MNRFIKFLLFIFIIVIVIVSIFYIDYFNVKTNNTNPKISIKEENSNYVLYKALFYEVYYCKTNKKYIIASYNEEVVCPNNYEYKNDYYTNTKNVKISKKDLQMLTNNGVFTSEMVENFKSDSEVMDAVVVANEFGKIKYKEIDEEDDYMIVVFPIFDKVDDNYDWIYKEDSQKYCLKGGNYNYKISKYNNDSCGKFESIKMNAEWCDLYKNSTLIYVKEIENLCD